MAIDQAIERLAQVDPRQAQMVELRFFAGLSVEETAVLLRAGDPEEAPVQIAAEARTAPGRMHAGEVHVRLIRVVGAREADEKADERQNRQPQHVNVQHAQGVGDREDHRHDARRHDG